LQTDYINKITWTAPEYGEAPVSYNIYRDPALTELVATIPASGTLQYYDHNRQPNVVYSYYITSVDSSGNQSTAASATVTNLC
jgi:fibronectin type 3 domain-containing protein